MSEPDLRQIQARFYRFVTAPEGVRSALAEDGLDPATLGTWIAERAGVEAALAPLGRLEVYAEAYFYRLLDVLRTDYPKLARAIGEVVFHNLVTDFLVAHPPADPSVRNAGLHLPAFLAGHALGLADPELPELASLERARLEVFDAADSEALDLAALQAMPPEAFATLRLRFVRAHQVLTLDPAVAVRWHAPEAPSAAGDTPCPWLVWRGRDPMVVHHVPLGPGDAALVPLLVAGAPFAEICERLAAGQNDDEAAKTIGAWLTRWTEAGALSDARPR